MDIPRLIALRQRMIDALLRQERTNANMSVASISTKLEYHNQNKS